MMCYTADVAQEGCQQPDACEWNWWPNHCQCRTSEGKRNDAPDPDMIMEGERLAKNIREIAQGRQGRVSPDAAKRLEVYADEVEGLHAPLRKLRDLAAGCAEVTPANDEVGSVARQTWETVVKWIDELGARSAQAPEPTGSAVACTCGTKTPDLRYHDISCEARKAAGL